MNRWHIFPVIILLSVIGVIMMGVDLYKQNKETLQEVSIIAREPLSEHEAIWDSLVVLNARIKDNKDSRARLQRSYNSLARKFEQQKAVKP